MSNYRQHPEEEDPRFRRQRREDAEESSQPQDGGLGGLLGGILGGAGQGQAEEEDPRGRRRQDDPRVSGAVSRRGGGGLLGTLLSNPRIGMAVVMMIGAVVTYYLQTKEEVNPVTDQAYRVVGDVQNDIKMGMQAAPEMIQQGKGEYRDQKLQAYIDRVGAKLVQANSKGDWAETFQQYHWDFHLLADEEMINAFALPGGQIFFTHGLFSKLKTEDEVAGVLGHEIGHVIARHSAKQMAKSQLINGVVMAGATAASDGQNNPGQIAQMVAGVWNMKYGRDDETQADTLGTQFMVNAGYHPDGLVKVMEILKAEMGNQRQPEFMSTHPDPGNRVGHIRQIIEDIKAGRIEGPK